MHRTTTIIPTNYTIADGIASGDVTDHSAIIWSRTNTQALMHVQYDTTLAFSHPKSTMVSVNQTTDFAGHVKLDSLSPDTVYYYVSGSPLPLLILLVLTIRLL